MCSEQRSASLTRRFLILTIFALNYLEHVNVTVKKGDGGLLPSLLWLSEMNIFFPGKIRMISFKL